MNHTPVANGKIEGIVMFLIVRRRALMQLLFAQQRYITRHESKDHEKKIPYRLVDAHSAPYIS